MTKPRRFAAWAALGALALGLLWPVASQACAVCFSGSSRSRLAFLETTAWMTLLPLGLIGGGLWWLRRGGSWLAGEFEDRDAYAPPEAPGPVPPAQEGDARTTDATHSRP